MVAAGVVVRKSSERTMATPPGVRWISVRACSGVGTVSEAGGPCGCCPASMVMVSSAVLLWARAVGMNESDAAAASHRRRARAGTGNMDRLHLIDLLQAGALRRRQAVCGGPRGE